ncbi:hypothetical protein RHMOL_Rhmol13G0106800 [Rhododendron molle]|uniref:Uncharacterized protein n=1 Tax=Rhododendron molle TaxID=49168 RepID=A0ACC0L5A5_RHOML|nr:hypothetical protein RHMOL_Rhmol13G0106800 [Rhododendron molle]
MEDMACLWSHQETPEELKQRLVYTTLKLELVRMESDKEMKNNKECMKQLLQLLKTSCQERDEARDQLNKLLNNLMPCTPNTLPEFLPPPPQLLPQSPLIQPAKGNSSITESNSLSADTFNYQSPVNSFFDPVSSPDSSSNFVFTNQPVFDQGCLVIDEIVKGRTLPPKGKLLQAVLEAGPLLQTLVVSGPLPRWRNPPPLQTFHIPPVSIKGCEAQIVNVPKQLNLSSFVDVSCGSSQVSMLDFSSGGFQSRVDSGQLMSAGANASSYVPLGKRQRYQ